MREYGKAVVIAFAGCQDHKLLNSARRLRKLFASVCAKCGATVLGGLYHQFSPQGASAAVLLAESHGGCHTWPQDDVATAIVYTCGSRVNLHHIASMLATALQAGSYRMRFVDLTRLAAVATSDLSDPRRGGT